MLCVKLIPVKLHCLLKIRTSWEQAYTGSWLRATACTILANLNAFPLLAYKWHRIQVKILNFQWNLGIYQTFSDRVTNWPCFCIPLSSKQDDASEACSLVQIIRPSCTGKLLQARPVVSSGIKFTHSYILTTHLQQPENLYLTESAWLAEQAITCPFVSSSRPCGSLGEMALWSTCSLLCSRPAAL